MKKNNLENYLIIETAKREKVIQGDKCFKDIITSNDEFDEKLRTLTGTTFLTDEKIFLRDIKTNFIVRPRNEGLVQQILISLINDKETALKKIFIMVCKKGFYYDVIDGNHVVEALKIYFKNEEETQIEVNYVFKENIQLCLYPLLQFLKRNLQSYPLMYSECINAIRLVLSSCKNCFHFDKTINNIVREQKANEFFSKLFGVSFLGNYIRYLWVFDNDQHWKLIMDKFGEINDYNFWINLCKRYYRAPNSAFEFYENCNDAEYKITYEYILKINGYASFDIRESEIFIKIVNGSNANFLKFEELNLKCVNDYKYWIIEHEIDLEEAALSDDFNKEPDMAICRYNIFTKMVTECNAKYVHCSKRKNLNCDFCNNVSTDLIEEIKSIDPYAAASACFLMFRNSDYRCKTLHEKFSFFYDYTFPGPNGILELKTFKSNDGLIEDRFDSECVFRFNEYSDKFQMSEKKDIEKNTCFICQSNLTVPDLKCMKDPCENKCHSKCAENMNFSGYTYIHAETNEGFKCHEHHCQKCFADGLHQRYELMIACKFCNLKFHYECVPAGCEITHRTIVCPRHVVGCIFPVRPSNYCFECNEKKTDGEKLLDCSNCSRSFHKKCHSFKTFDENYDRGIRCSYCIRSNFVKYGEYVYAQYNVFEYNLGFVVRNDEYRREETIPHGSYVIEWIGKNLFEKFSIVSHYRTIAFTENIWFHKEKDNFPLLLKIQDYKKIYKKIMKNFFANQKLPCRMETIEYCRNSKFSFISLNKDQIKLSKVQRNIAHVACNCEIKQDNRCGDGRCSNRATLVECSKACEPFGCNNRLISNKSHLFNKLEIFYTKNCGFGVRAKCYISEGTFIGEYCGEVIDNEELNVRQYRNDVWNSKDVSFYTMKLEDFFVDAQFYGSIIRYFNHSCNPNCESQIYNTEYGSHVVLFAIKDILIGQELTFKYSASYNKNNITIKCLCGEKNCCGTFEV